MAVNPVSEKSGSLPSRPVLLLRSLAFWIVMMTSTILLTFPVIIAALTSESLCQKLVRLWVWVNLTALEKICKLGYRIEGFDTLPEDPCILFSKHQSTWETLMLKYLLPAAIFVAKKELIYIPFFGWALGSLRFVLINRGSGRKAIRQMVDQYIERKSRGLWLVIFPEGTRKAVGAKPDYKIGGAVVALETDTGVVPVAVNAGEFWPRHSFIKWPGTVTLSFGPVVRPAGKSADEIRDEAKDWIETKMAEITVIDRFPY